MPECPEISKPGHRSRTAVYARMPGLSWSVWTGGDYSQQILDAARDDVVRYTKPSLEVPEE